MPAAALRHRTLVAANLSAFFIFGAFFSFIFLGSLLMQQVLGYSPTKTGVSWLATSVTAFIASGLTGARLVERSASASCSLPVSRCWRSACCGWHVCRPMPITCRTCCRRSSRPGWRSACARRRCRSARCPAWPSRRRAGLGLVETMREIGGAAGVAAVATALVSRAGLDGFHAGFVLIASWVVGSAHRGGSVPTSLSVGGGRAGRRDGRSGGRRGARARAGPGRESLRPRPARLSPAPGDASRAIRPARPRPGSKTRAERARGDGGFADRRRKPELATASVRASSRW